MNELHKQLEELKTKIAELEKTITQEKNGEWKPRLNETYFCIDSEKTIYGCEWENDGIDNFNLEKHNCYKTRDEAQFALDMYEFCRERSFVPDWESMDEVRCIIGLNHQSQEKLVINFDGDYFVPFYYPTHKKAQEVIDKYTFDELAKYYGRV